jgi:L-fucose isomerase
MTAIQNWRKWDLWRRRPPQRAGSGFQGQRQWTDYLPNGDFWNLSQFQLRLNGIRPPYIMATETIFCNGVAMPFRSPNDRSGPGIRRRAHLWSPEAIRG